MKQAIFIINKSSFFFFNEIRVFRTQTFDKGFEKLPKSEQREVERFEKKLSENPFLGKPLDFVFFREKRLNSRRVYYLVYEDFVVVLMVGVSDKKAQQATIDAIKDKGFVLVRKSLFSLKRII